MSGRDEIQIVKQSHGIPFSKGLLAQSFTATGLAPDRAYGVAMEVERYLRESGVPEIGLAQLRGLAERVLGEEEGGLFLERYRKWNRLAVQDRPVVILIGGATGVGKSTLATQLAHRLGIVRIISTDSIREVMRVFFSADLMPAVHYSSFNADGSVRIPVGKRLDPHILGFVEQTEMVSVGIKAIMERAVRERTSMVVEGVHLVPGFIPDIPVHEALALPMVVAVRDRELHRSHFLVRAEETAGRRPFQRYLENLDAIRKVQDYILERADHEGTLTIENVNIDETVGTVVDNLYRLIEKSEELDKARASGPEDRVGEQTLENP